MGKEGDSPYYVPCEATCESLNRPAQREATVVCISTICNFAPDESETSMLVTTASRRVLYSQRVATSLKGVSSPRSQILTSTWKRISRASLPAKASTKVDRLMSSWRRLLQLAFCKCAHAAHERGKIEWACLSPSLDFARVM